MIRFNCNNSVSASGREETEHGTALFPAACYEDDLAETSVPWHWHEELELAVATAGTVLFATDRERLELKSGEGCVVNAGVIHAVWNGGEGECGLRSIVFHPRLLGGTAESVYWQKYLLPLLQNHTFRVLKVSSSENGEILHEIESAWHLCADEPEGYELLARNELSGLLLRLWKRVPAPPGKRPEREKRNEERLKEMLSYIRAHLSEEITIREIADAASVSESECIRCFRNTIGTTPVRYTRQLRLHEAAELLAGTDRKIIDIGNDCGFREMNYFCRSFREQFGMTPTEYRRQNQSQRGEGSVFL